MNEPTCRICVGPTGDDKPWIVDLLGAAAHVECLEETGEWDTVPRARDEEAGCQNSR